MLLCHRLDQGGSERQMTEVAKGLNRDAFSPHVGSFHPIGIRAVELQAAKVPILHLPVTSFASLSTLRGGLTFLRYIKRHQIRLVHSFDVPLNIFAVPFATLAQSPVVLSSQRAHRQLTPGIYTQLLRLTDKLVDGIVVNCLHMRDHLIIDEHVPPNLVHLCYNAIDLSVFNREQLPSALPADFVPKGGTVIGVVCALRPEKGLITLISAFEIVHRCHPTTRLLIVGSGPMLEALKFQVETLSLRNVTMFVSRTADVAPWLRAMAIFVLPSETEAFSNSLMEAMACGCCCVASLVGGNPELLGSNTRGLLFAKGNAGDLAKALSTLLRDTSMRDSLADAGNRYIHSFDKSVSIRCMEELYSMVLEERRTKN